MKVYISKYALTKGIEEKEATIEKDTACVLTNDIYHNYYHGKGIEWHLTKENAIRRANELREKKIKNLEKQLKKLKEMKFE